VRRAAARQPGFRTADLLIALLSLLVLGASLAGLFWLFSLK
jgi:hypothetical protein